MSARILVSALVPERFVMTLTIVIVNYRITLLTCARLTSAAVEVLAVHEHPAREEAAGRAMNFGQGHLESLVNVQHQEIPLCVCC